MLLVSLMDDTRWWAEGGGGVGEPYKCLYCNVNPFFFMTNNREWYPLIILEAFPVDS